MVSTARYDSPLGGILIAARDTMPLDEYGNPVPGLFDGLTLKRRKQSEPVVIVPGAELPVPDSLQRRGFDPFRGLAGDRLYEGRSGGPDEKNRQRNGLLYRAANAGLSGRGGGGRLAAQTRH